MKKRKVKKSVIRLTKVLLAIMMVFTTFTNMPTLVSANDETNAEAGVVETTDATTSEPAQTVPEPEQQVEPAPEVVPQPEEQPAGTPVVEETQPSAPAEPSATPTTQPSETPEGEENKEETPAPTATADAEKDEQAPETSPSALPEETATPTPETTEEAEKLADELVYDVDFDTQEIMEPTKGYVGEEVEVAAMTLTREGYNFLYWYVLNEDGTETQYNPGDKFVLTEGEDKLVAKWEEVVTEVPNDDSESEEVVENEDKVYTVILSHTLNTEYGAYHREDTLTLTEKDFTDGKYDLTKNQFVREGMIISANQNLVISKDDFAKDDLSYLGYENAVYFNINYEIAPGYKVVKPRVLTRSIYIGTLDENTPEINKDDELLVKVVKQDEDGVLLAQNEYIVINKENEQFSFNYDLTDSEGYEILVNDPFRLNENTITAVFDNNDKEVTLTITYKAKEIKYTVKHLFETLDGDFVVDEEKTQELTGKYGELTEAIPYEVNGFTSQEVIQQPIGTTDALTIEIKYDRNTYYLTYNTNGGSYVSKKSAKFEEEITVYNEALTCTKEEHVHTDSCYEDYLFWQELVCGKEEHTHDATCYSTDNVPIKQGYTFTGWYLDPECTTPAAETMQLSADVTVYAGWEASQANFTVVVMKEKYNDDGTETSYVYESSKSYSGTVGTTVNAGDYRNNINISDGNRFYNYDHSTSATVAADGSTVVYLYYKLAEYTITFDLGNQYNSARLTIGGEIYKKAEYKIIVKLGQNISSIYPTVDNIYGVDNFYGWNPTHDNSTYITKRPYVTSDMLPKNSKTVTYDAIYRSGSLYTVNYYLENAENNEYTLSE